MHAERLETKKILDAICVSPPYFNLKDITRLKDNSLRATIYTEQPLGMEVFPISAAETGRHLAILGTCVLGLEAGDRKNYYLATKAEMVRISTTETHDKELYGIARGKFCDKRSGIAETELRTFKNERIYSLSVVYSVIPVPLFKRMFDKYKQESATEYINPYTQEYPLKTAPSIQEDRLELNLDRVAPDRCLGHFHSYPAMPVAFLAYQQAHTAGLLLKHRLKSNALKYMVVKCSLHFTRLAFAGEALRLVTLYLGNKDNVYMFRCEAYCEGEYMGASEIDLQTVSER